MNGTESKLFICGVVVVTKFYWMFKIREKELTKYVVNKKLPDNLSEMHLCLS